MRTGNIPSTAPWLMSNAEIPTLITLCSHMGVHRLVSTISTHCNPNKMANNAQTAFSKAFLERKLLCFDSNFTAACSQWSY